MIRIKSYLVPLFRTHQLPASSLVSQFGEADFVRRLLIEASGVSDGIAYSYTTVVRKLLEHVHVRKKGSNPTEGDASSDT